ncbi:integrase [Salinimonas sediminis]|uniref:Integrase n=1 Tax=Salinimonas sediminis TaxID=2303538 RepID=A0A346NMA8_9ALTE|nr:integrase [Salinimonas sediminis]AXR06665.1 integrase [Salinimonas sediminis]
MEGRPITNAELWEQLIPRNCGRQSELRHRNKLLILLATLTGLREIELTLITNRLFITPEGQLNEVVVLPESITRDGYERPMVLSHPELKRAFECYFEWLIQHKINSYPHKHYYGLDPNAALLIADNFKPFTTQSRGSAISPFALNKKLDSLISDAGLWNKGVRRISLVRTCVIEMYRNGVSTTDIMIITGFSEESIKQILTMDYMQLSPIYDWFEQRADRKQKRLDSFKKRRRFML